MDCGKEMDDPGKEDSGKEMDDPGKEDSGKEKEDSGMENGDSSERKEDPGGGGGEGEMEPGGAKQEKPPDEVTAANPDESQPALSEVKRYDVFYSNDHIELYFYRALEGTWTA